MTVPDEPRPCYRNYLNGCQAQKGKVSQDWPLKGLRPPPSLGVPSPRERRIPGTTSSVASSQATYWVKVVLVVGEPFKQEATWRRENRFGEEEQKGTGVAPESQLRYSPNSHFHPFPWKITGQMHSLTQTESSQGTPSASAIHSC